MNADQKASEDSSACGSLSGCKSLLKKARGSQPFNYLATSLFRSLFRLTGTPSEWVIKHLHKVGVVRATLPNGRTLCLWSRGDDWISNQVFWRGWSGYEADTTPLFFHLATQAEVTLDVGAYVGFYSLVAAHANPHAHVYAFEPLPSITARLRRNVELNRASNVECVASAVGDVEGTAAFFHVSTALPSSSSLSEAFMGTGEGIVRSMLPVVRLDRFLEERKVGRVGLMKIDTESTEPQVLAGMSKTLHRDRPHIVCEVLLGRGSESALDAFLRPLGYRFYLLTPHGPALRERVEGHPEYLNYLFTTLDPDAVRQLWETAIQGASRR